LFKANLADRRGNRLLIERNDMLRPAFRTIRTERLFRKEEVAALPDPIGHYSASGAYTAYYLAAFRSGMDRSET
jgi:hypothetical protein